MEKSAYNGKLPKFAKQVLKLYAADAELHIITGDFEEGFTTIAGDKGKFHAWVWYILQIIKMLMGRLYNSIQWSFPMFKNYMKTAFRNISKNKVYAIINIFGLSIALACTILIYLFIKDELSYDKFHKNLDKIYRLTTIFNKPDGSVDWIYGTVLFPHGPAMKEFFPEVKYSVRVYDRDYSVKSEYLIASEAVTFVDKNFFEMFTFPLLKGNPSTVLSHLNSVILTEEWAQKYFGDENPLGKVLTISFDNYFNDFTVTGIAESPPENSTIKFNIVVNFESLRLFGYRERFSSWRSWSSTMQTYIMLDDDFAAERILNRYPEFSHKYYAQLFSSWRTTL